MHSKTLSLQVKVINTTHHLSLLETRAVRRVAALGAQKRLLVLAVEKLIADGALKLVVRHFQWM